MSYLTHAVFTNKGSRDINEDSVGNAGDGTHELFVLCDGLGGHGMGDQASQLVVSVFQDQFRKLNNIKQFLPESFSAAQDILIAAQQTKHAEQKMKTTGVALLTDGKNAYIGHVGDSRLYIFRKNQVMKRTLDHSIPQMLAISGDIKDSEIRNHPQRNIVLRVLGVEWEQPMFELMKPVPLKKCQAFLLCSDGFWELITEEEMCDILARASSVEEWLSAMADVVMRNGEGKNMDNFSAIAIWNNQ